MHFFRYPFLKYAAVFINFGAEFTHVVVLCGADFFLDEKGRGYVVYSVGDGNIIVHDPKNLREEAVVLSKLIYTANPQYVVSISVLCW